MKRNVIAIALLVIFGIQMGVLAAERVMSAVIPEADLMFYMDMLHGKETPFGKAAKAFDKAHEHDAWRKMDNDLKLDEMEEIKAFIKKLGYDDVNDVFSKVCGSLTFKLDGQTGEVEGIENFAAAIELTKPLDTVKALALLKEKLAKDKDSDVNVTFGFADGMPMITVECKKGEDDDFELKRVTFVIVDAKTVVFGSDAVWKDVVGRYKANKTVEMRDYFKNIKGDFFLALAMTPEIRKELQKVQKQMPQLASLIEAEGFAMVINVSDALYFDLCARMKTHEAADIVKTNVIDGFIQPMILLSAPSIKQEVGGEFPVIDSFKGETAGNVVKLGCKFSMKDLEVCYAELQKIAEAKGRMEALEDDDDDDDD